MRSQNGEERSLDTVLFVAIWEFMASSYGSSLRRVRVAEVIIVAHGTLLFARRYLYHVNQDARRAAETA